MKGLLAMLASIAVAIVCWGVYGPVLREGQLAMQGSTLRPFICVGLAYFFIAVLAPVIVLYSTGEKGSWTAGGIIWSLVAGAVGAVGALGIILALRFRGNPLYVMPLVFGCAPVVNTFLTMYWTKSFKQVNPMFMAGMIVVAIGAVTVLLFRPVSHGGSEIVKIDQLQGGGISVDVTHDGDPVPVHYEAASVEELQSKHPDAFKLYRQHARLTPSEFLWVVLATAMTALCWGAYGPTLHRGQMNMAGSRLRPLICVGLAYMLIAVLIPSLLLTRWNEPGLFTTTGSMWSLAGGAAGALGALGIIMAFNFGGKPIFVMPLVFGGAPVVNTFASMAQSGVHDLNILFVAGLLLVAGGAVSVLIFAPKGGGHPPHTPEPAPIGEPAPTT